MHVVAIQFRKLLSTTPCALRALISISSAQSIADLKDFHAFQLAALPVGYEVKFTSCNIVSSVP